MERGIVKIEEVQHFYFDHNATTPVSPEVLETAVACLGQVYGNASSIHHFGQVAKQRLEMARRQTGGARSAASRAEIVFISGGTEADNLALFGVVRARRTRPQTHVITTAIEHPAVLNACAQLEREGVAVTYVPRGRGRHGGSGRCPPRAAAGHGAGFGDACQQRVGNRAADGGDRAHRARGRRAICMPMACRRSGKIPVDVDALGVDLY